MTQEPLKSDEKKPTNGTSTILVERLNAISAPSDAVKQILQNAKALKYDDVHSDLPLPHVQLLEDLTAAGLDDLIEDLLDGDFD